MRYFIVYMAKDFSGIHIANTEINWYKEINSIKDIREIEERMGNRITILNYKKMFDE